MFFSCNEFLKRKKSGGNVNTMFPNEGDLSDRVLLLPGQKNFAPDCNRGSRKISATTPPPTESGRLMGIPKNFCYYPPPPTESGRFMGIPKNFCYYPPPSLNLAGLWGSRKISATTPPPTESGRPAEIMEKWPPPKKILATPLVWEDIRIMWDAMVDLE